jgi:hypothetical protein
VAIAVLDFNHDGRNDIVVSEEGVGLIGLTNNGFSVFNPMFTNAATDIQGLMVGDLNGDGKDDLVATLSTSDSIRVFMANSTNLGAGIDFPVGTGPQTVAAGLLNDDQVLDLVVVNSTSSSISTLLNLTPTAANSYITAIEENPKAITLIGTGAGALLTFEVVAGPRYGTLTGTSPTFTYTSTNNYYGQDTFTFRVTDGSITSATYTAFLRVLPVNDAPSFSFQSPSLGLIEDSAQQFFLNWATNLSKGPTNESNQGVHFICSNTRPELFRIQPYITSFGQLYVAPKLNANGMAEVTVIMRDNGGIVNGGEDSFTSAFTIYVTNHNDAPTFTKGTNVTVMEDSGDAQIVNWVRNISPGPPDENSQTVSFVVLSNSNPNLFRVAPAVSPSGTLTFTPATDSNGYATVYYRLTDDDGTENGGVNASAPASLRITVVAVNDPPDFLINPAYTNIAVNEDGPLMVISNFLGSKLVGPPDEVAARQGFTFTVANNCPPIFTTQPVLDSFGTLRFKSRANSNGTVLATVTMKDSGGLSNHGQNSTSKTFAINITAVNDAPNIRVGSAVTVDEDCGEVNRSNWATAISSGAANEADQVLTYTVVNNKPELFAVQPTISSSGVLNFTPAADANGMVLLFITVKDDGGIDFGGTDTASQVLATINVKAVNDAPKLTLIDPVNLQANAGVQKVQVFRDCSAGPANEASQSWAFTVLNNSNPYLFLTLPTINFAGELSCRPKGQAGTATLTVRMSDTGGSYGINSVFATVNIIVE